MGAVLTAGLGRPPPRGSARDGLCWAGCSAKRLSGESICGSHDASVAFASHQLTAGTMGWSALQMTGRAGQETDSPSPSCKHALAVPAEHSTLVPNPSAPSCCREDRSPSAARRRTALLLVGIDGQSRSAWRNPAGCLLPAEPQQPQQQRCRFGRALGLQGGYQRSVIWVLSGVRDYVFNSQAQM